jgi:hypothetical protein
MRDVIEIETETETAAACACPTRSALRSSATIRALRDNLARTPHPYLPSPPKAGS